jgi:hypothetical protein
VLEKVSDSACTWSGIFAEIDFLSGWTEGADNIGLKDHERHRFDTNPVRI